MLAAGFEQELAPTLGTTEHVGLVLGLTTDTGNTNEACPLVHEPRAVRIDILLNIHIIAH